MRNLGFFWFISDYPSCRLIQFLFLVCGLTQFLFPVCRLHPPGVPGQWTSLRVEQGHLHRPQHHSGEVVDWSGGSSLSISHCMTYMFNELVMRSCWVFSGFLRDALDSLFSIYLNDNPHPLNPGWYTDHQGLGLTPQSTDHFNSRFWLWNPCPSLFLLDNLHSMLRNYIV